MKITIDLDKVILSAWTMDEIRTHVKDPDGVHIEWTYPLMDALEEVEHFETQVSKRMRELAKATK
jgi:phosphoserine phosphatase